MAEEKIVRGGGLAAIQNIKYNIMSTSEDAAYDIKVSESEDGNSVSVTMHMVDKPIIQHTTTGIIMRLMKELVRIIHCMDTEFTKENGYTAVLINYELYNTLDEAYKNKAKHISSILSEVEEDTGIWLPKLIATYGSKLMFTSFMNGLEECYEFSGINDKLITDMEQGLNRKLGQ